MKITLDIPDGIIAGFFNGVEVTAHGMQLVSYQLSTDDLKDWKPVVHCKDCKHKGWVQEPCHGKSIDYCRVWDCTLRDLETNFCSYGERKNADESEVR